MTSDHHRAAILRRRASFLGASLAALGCSGPATTAPEPTPAAPPPPSATTARVPSPPSTTAPVTSALAPAPAAAMVCLSIRIVHAVQFAHGAMTPTAEGQVVLDETLEVLSQNTDLRVVIEGHTDASEPAYGRKVALQRARHVHRYFTSRGIDPARLCTVDSGASKPLTPGKNPAERAANRRVSFLFLDDGASCP